MIGREKRVLLRHYLEQGLSKAAIARRAGVSERTLYRWIASGQLDRELDNEPVRYGPRRRRPSKLDPYKEIIEVRLAEYPELSAVRLFEEVEAAGYPGGYGQVKRYVREVRPRPPEEPVQRFETGPGHQAQVDFAEFRLPWGKRQALIVVLGYSRYLWLQYYERQTMEVVMRGLEAAFVHFRGVPAEILFDQMKAVIIEDGRADGGRLVENQEFLRFASHWGFHIRACRPYRARGQRPRPRDAEGAPGGPVRGGAAVSKAFGALALPAGGPPASRAGAPDGWRSADPSVRRGRASPAGRLRPLQRRGLVRPPSRRERIAAQLADLKMPGALEALDEVLAGFDGGKHTAAEAIERLLATQISLRNSRRLEAAMRSSRLPYVRTLENFDFSFQPSIKREQIAALSLAITAAENGRKIYFGTLTDLVDSLEEAKAAGRLNRRLKTLTHPALLIVDEIGYLPVTQSGAVLFFQLVNRRYGHASTVLTSNKGFEEWGRILGDEVMAAALRCPATIKMSGLRQSG